MKLGVRAIVGGLLAACALVGFSAAFAFAAGAESGPAQTTTTTTTTDPPPTPAPPPAPPPTQPAPPPRQVGIPGGVKIGAVDVGGLLPYQAASRVRKSFVRPLVLVVSPTRKVQLSPEALGAKPAVDKAVSRARFSRPGAAVPLHVWVSRDRIRGYVESLGREVDRAPVSAQLVLRGATVGATRSVDGRRLERVAGSRSIRIALKTNSRPAIRLSFAVLKPTVAADKLGPAVVILRSSNQLRLYAGAKLVRTFGVATGQAAYPTPTGNFEIVTMQRNPWWYPPPSDWAADSDPVPPGPGNPLGTRWMGISAPYVGIHGTPDSASIGYSASHGCVRMRIPDAEWLFQHVEVGTPVFIVSK
ncbi:MAG: L,D-transpeptidase/peptidoglycan binding protein [Actinobacteria bacterium]|nr:L,D-transpeptidase/peptidoglycan binding protein [Actinomycetota bacterium]